VCGSRTRAHAQRRNPFVFSLISRARPGMVPADYAHMVNVQNAGCCAALLSRVDGDVEIFSELCDIFLDDAPKRLSAIRVALEARDGKALRAAAHAFKGAAGVFDATGIVDAARRLEQMGDEGCLEGADGVFRELEIFSRLLIDEIRATRETKIWKS
jgi:HPt (histidine-containing phosphotransfer) domain-containing protein